MAVVHHCRGCRVSLGTNVIPEFMGIGSLFGDEEANNTTDMLLCAKCVKGHDNSSFVVQSCGHHNLMNKNQSKSTSCYQLDCAKTNDLPQTEDDDCIFCSEILASATCVSFQCNHIFHESCITTHFNNMLAPKSGLVGIANAFCPLCKADLKWTGEYSKFYKTMQDVNGLREHMKSLCIAQIQKESGDAMPSNPLEYGMKHFNFYQCNKCKSLYCGGKRECGDAEPEGDNVYLCGGCRGCPKHGDEFMSYKCRYCCNEALFLCFGHTHYCDYCHSHNLRATGTNYQYMTSAPAPCEGRSKCPLKIDHPPHGEEFAIRCNACADEVKDEWGCDIVTLYEQSTKRDLVLEALELNQIEKMFGGVAPVILERVAEDDVDGFWDLRMLHGEEEEEEEDFDWLGLFGDDEPVRVAEVARGNDWEEDGWERLRGLIDYANPEVEDRVRVEEQEEREEREDGEDWGTFRGLFEDEESEDENEESEGASSSPTGPTTTETEIPTAPSSPILRHMSRLIAYVPQLVVVAATAAFLNGASYTLV